MANEDTTRLTGAADEGPAVAVEPESRARAVTRQVLRRWKAWSTVLVTGATTWLLLEIEGTWTLDSLAFGAITVGLFVYAVVTLASDLELE